MITTLPVRGWLVVQKLRSSVGTHDARSVGGAGEDTEKVARDGVPGYRTGAPYCQPYCQPFLLLPAIF